MAKVLQWIAAALSLVVLSAGMSLAGTYTPQVLSQLTSKQPAQTNQTATDTPQTEVAQPTTPAPAPTPPPAPDRTAVTNSFVRLRAGKSTSTAILAELQGGTTVILLDEVDELWQQVKYNDLTGYIYKSYLTY